MFDMKINFERIKNPLLIAEVGINHNGKLDQALKLVDSAKKSGADAIKFQTYKTEKRVKKNNNVYNILKKCELSFDEFYKIKKYCDKNKIIFFSTPFDLESVDFLEKINVPIYKVASFDISNFSLLRKIILTKKPTIISTGMASLKEINQTYTLFKKNNVDLAMLHCVSAYPNKEESSYLSNITYLKNKFNCVIGLSDHTNDIKTSIYASLLGAKIFEKHFMLSKNYRCVDNPVSLYPAQFLKLKNELITVNKILSKPKFGIKPEEKKAIKFKRNKIL